MATSSVRSLGLTTQRYGNHIYVPPLVMARPALGMQHHKDNLMDGCTVVLLLYCSRLDQGQVFLAS